MIRRTVTFDPAIDQIVNLIRGLALLVGIEYNYTEVVNGLAYYGLCYWLSTKKENAVAMAPKILTTDLKLEGFKDELEDKFRETLSKLAENKTKTKKNNLII
jgi:hypothetical protein